MLLFWYFILWFLQDDPSLFQLNGRAQGTTYSIKYVSTDSLVSRTEIDSLFQAVDHSLSLYDTGSLISHFNIDGFVLMDSYMRDVLKASLEVYQASEGGFDITTRQLSLLWGFGESGPEKKPSKKQIKAALSLTGMDKLIIRNDSLLALKKNVLIDCNGIAQGYTVDLISALLECKGIRNYIVELGGEVRTAGQPNNNRKWIVGIESPGVLAADFHPVIKSISMENKSVTTSGNYRNYVSYGKQNYGHVIDPHSGAPVKNGIISVTVVADNAITADAWDNGFFVMGWKASLKMLEKRNNMQAYFIFADDKGNIKDTATVGFYKLLK
jgi:FAD:protein FMN transferase